MGTTTEHIIPSLRSNLARGIYGVPMESYRRALRRSWIPTPAGVLAALLIASCCAWAYTAWNGQGISAMRVKDAAIVASRTNYPPGTRAAAILHLNSEAIRVRDALRNLVDDPEVGAAARQVLSSLEQEFKQAPR